MSGLNQLSAGGTNGGFRDRRPQRRTTELGARSGHGSRGLGAPRQFHDHAGCQCIFGFLASLLNRRSQLTFGVVRHPGDSSEHDGFHEIGMHRHCSIRAAGSSSGFRLRSTNDRRLAVSTSVELPSLMTSTDEHIERAAPDPEIAAGLGDTHHDRFYCLALSLLAKMICRACGWHAGRSFHSFG